MELRPPATGAVLALALALALAFAFAPTAAAQIPLTGSLEAPAPPAPTSPEPLWVPDPEPRAATGDVLADVSAAEVVAQAQAAALVPAADDPARISIAHWMADGALSAGLPPELPVMAALVESSLRNLPYGDRDSVGYFQMRLGIWNRGPYEGYLARPELQLRWFVDHALAVQARRVAAGDAAFGTDPATWGDWIADVEQPAGRYRLRYQQRLAEAQALLAAPAASLAPFELALTVGGPGQEVTPAGELAARVLADARITLDARAGGDLAAGIVDPRLSAVLLAAADRYRISVTVLETGHSYLTRGGSVSNHSSGRAVDIGVVDGVPVSPANAAAHALALTLGALPADLRPTEIGSPWAIDDPAYFTDGDHQNHLHVGFDDPLGATATATATAAVEPSAVPVIVPSATATARPRRAARAPVEPRFAAAGADDDRRSGTRRGADEPRFRAGEAKP